MAKKEIKTIIKKISNIVNCKCGKEWIRKEIENDQTIHTIVNYHYRFLRTFTTNSNGFLFLVELNSCPDCRNSK